MSDRDETRDFSDETMAMPLGGSGGPPTSGGRGGGPTHTMPLAMPGEQPPGRGRQVLIYLLVLLLGLAGGFAIAQFIGADDDSKVPSEDLVLYENATTTFPVEGAQFTKSTFDSAKSQCDRELLKQYLRADRFRLNHWLDLQEITDAELDAFIDRLKTRILTEATPVTNYGCFPDGEGPCPFSVQSVLGPGTPVWFDPVQSRIIAKCTCSNPIRFPKCPPNCEEIPTPTPTPTPTPSPTPSPSPTPTRSPSPTPSPTPSPSPTVTPTLTPAFTFTPQPPN